MAIRWARWMQYLTGGLWNPEVGQQSSGPSTGHNAAGVVLTDATAMQVAAVFRCIRIIAETCGSLPLVAYKRVGKYDQEPLPRDHWLPQLISEPNETMSGDEFSEAMYANMAGWGNGYAQIVPNSAGRATELWPYKTDRMTVARQVDRTLVYKYPDPYGLPVELPSNRVLHLRAFSPDGIMGLSPLSLARQSMGLAVAAQNYASSFFSSGGRPSGVMTSDKLLSDKQREQIRTEFGGIADGASEGGKRFWVLEGSLKYTPITVNPEDLQMLQTRSFEVAEIARFFGVPLFLLMEQEKSTSWGSGIEQFNLSFLTYTLRPYLERMEAAWNRWIIPPAERSQIFVEIDVSPLLRADLAGLASYYSQLAQNGIMTRNEIRRPLKLPAMTGGDELTVQVNLTPLAKLGEVSIDQAANLQNKNRLGEDSNVVSIRAPQRAS